MSRVRFSFGPRRRLPVRHFVRPLRLTFYNRRIRWDVMPNVAAFVVVARQYQPIAALSSSRSVWFVTYAEKALKDAMSTPVIAEVILLLYSSVLEPSICVVEFEEIKVWSVDAYVGGLVEW